jgi:hypothetical protein
VGRFETTAALKPFRAFIEAVEGEEATLASAYASLQPLYQGWEAMPSNEAAAILSEEFDRYSSTLEFWSGGHITRLGRSTTAKSSTS